MKQGKRGTESASISTGRLNVIRPPRPAPSAIRGGNQLTAVPIPHFQGTYNTTATSIKSFEKKRVNLISDQRSTVAPSDSDRDCSSGQRDPDNRSKWPPGAGLSTNPGQDSESGGSQPPSPKAGRKRQVGLNRSI